jgi:hypothetical protein
MIDTISNLLFRCSHKRLTRPLSAVTKTGEPRGGTYVVCLDCGKQFPYDLQTMRVGKAAIADTNAGVLHPPVVPPRGSKLKYAALALPAAFFLGKALMKPRQPAQSRRESPPESGGKSES